MRLGADSATMIKIRTEVPPFDQRGFFLASPLAMSCIYLTGDMKLNSIGQHRKSSTVELVLITRAPLLLSIRIVKKRERDGRESEKAKQESEDVINLEKNKRKSGTLIIYIYI